jgi:DNA-binding transcriptional regulator YhcF (GntR family)
LYNISVLIVPAPAKSEAIISIDLSSPIPAYRQIADAIRACLVEGQLKPGDKLPAVRDLATDLGVHHNTVAETYRRLAAEGWLEVRRRRGAIVRRRDKLAAPPGADASFAQRLRELVAKALADGLPRRAVAERLSSAANRVKEAAS